MSMITPGTPHWEEVLRLAASIQQGTVTASLRLRTLGSYSRQNGLAVALRALCRIERTLCALDWMQNVELRRRGHLSRAFEASEQQIDRLTHQLGTAGMLLICQLIQQGQLALSEMYAHGD
jgi:TnpA family transposase